jgi:PPOX class probable F420-dependent enzyme
MTVLNDEARALFAGPNIAHIATLLPDGGPHSVPVMIDIEGECLVFFTSPNSRKGRNLVADDRIAISVTDRENLVRSALVRGRVVKRIGGDAGWEIVDRIFAKYTGGPYPRGEDREAFLVEPARVIVPTFA